MKLKLLAQLHVPGLPADLGGGNTPTVDAGLSATGRFISSMTSLLLIIAAVAAFLYFILGGIQWITSSGDKAGLEAARNKITNAILGLVIVASAWAVWILVGNFLGINVKNLPFPTVNQ